MLLWPCCMTSIPFCLLLPSNALPHFAQNFWDIPSGSQINTKKFTWCKTPRDTKLTGYLWILFHVQLCWNFQNFELWILWSLCWLFFLILLASVKLKWAAFLHISKENENFSSASLLARSHFPWSSWLTRFCADTFSRVFYRASWRFWRIWVKNMLFYGSWIFS